MKLNSPTPPKEKWCPKCRIQKKAEAFYTSQSKISGLQDYCKLCQNKTSMTYLTNNPEKRDQNNREYRKRNPDKVRDWDRNAKVKRRRLLSSAEFDNTISLDRLYERDKGICQLCKSECIRIEASIDHIIPLSKGGDHLWTNIQLAHLKCNSLKKDKIL